MIKAVIFDLDDTLISERQYIESGYKHISKLLSERYNIELKQIYQLLINLLDESSKNVFNRFFEKMGITYTKKIILELVEEYRNHFPTIKFFDDVLPCLNVLNTKGIKTGIITDGYANCQKQKLRALNAYDYFDEIIVTDELGRNYWKPHPKGFELMKEKMEVDFKNMVYIGDNPKKDFYISSIFPITTVRISRKQGIYNDKNYLLGIKENYLIKALDGNQIINLNK